MELAYTTLTEKVSAAREDSAMSTSYCPPPTGRAEYGDSQNAEIPNTLLTL